MYKDGECERSNFGSMLKRIFNTSSTMEASLFFLFALVSTTYGQYMSSWGSSQGYTNQMQMPYGHMPYHHGYREASVESIPIGPTLPGKGEAVMPIQMFRAKVPSRLGLQDYSLLNVNGPDHEEMTEHMVFRQSMGDMKRPVVGVLSLLSTPLPIAMNAMNAMNTMANSMGNMGNKANVNYPDTSSADEMMTCVGMDMGEPLKVHSAEPRIIINRGIPYFTQSMHKIK